MLKDFADIYIAMVSSTHNVCAKDVYIAIVSTIVETDKPELEIQPGLQLLGAIHDKYVSHALMPHCCADNVLQVRHRLPRVHPHNVGHRGQHLRYPFLRRDIALRDRR